MYKSMDAGLNWISVEEFSGLSVRSIFIGFGSGSGVVTVGTFGQGAFVSNDGGVQWKIANEGLDDLNIRVIVIDTEIPGLFYAGTSSEGFYRSKNSGRTWSPINKGLSKIKSKNIIYRNFYTRGVMISMFNDEAKAFPKLNPTERHTIKPGPLVDATASISLIFIPL